MDNIDKLGAKRAAAYEKLNAWIDDTGVDMQKKDPRHGLTELTSTWDIQVRKEKGLKPSEIEITPWDHGARTSHANYKTAAEHAKAELKIAGIESTVKNKDSDGWNGLVIDVDQPDFDTKMIKLMDGLKDKAVERAMKVVNEHITTDGSEAAKKQAAALLSEAIKAIHARAHEMDVTNLVAAELAPKAGFGRFQG